MLGMMSDMRRFQVWTFHAAVIPSGAVKRKGPCKDTTAFGWLSFSLCSLSFFWEDLHHCSISGLALRGHLSGSSN